MPEGSQGDGSRAAPSRLARLGAWGHRVGHVLAAVGLAFVGWTFWAHRAELLSWQPGWRGWLVVGAAVLAHGVAAMSLGQAWRLLLAWHGGRLSPREAHVVYGRALVAKYIPGSVAQVVGRQGLATARGVPALAALLSTAHEAGALLASASIVALPAALAYRAHAPLAALPLVLAVVGAVVVPAVMARRSRGVEGRSWRQLALAHALQGGYFCVFFALPVVLATAVSGWPGAADAARLVGITAVAWAAGFVTPGPPAGLGVREVVFVALAGHAVEPAHAVLLAALVRLVTILGDLLFFTTALTLPQRDGSPLRG